MTPEERIEQLWQNANRQIDDNRKASREIEDLKARVNALEKDLERCFSQVHNLYYPCE